MKYLMTCDNPTGYGECEYNTLEECINTLIRNQSTIFCIMKASTKIVIAKTTEASN